LNRERERDRERGEREEEKERERENERKKLFIIFCKSLIVLKVRKCAALSLHDI
jgi:hypothetical protein